MAEVNWIDGTLSAMLLASAIFGLFRGLIRGVFGIAGLVFAFFVARRFGDGAGLVISSFLDGAAFGIALGYALVFVAAAVAFGALTYLLRRAAARADLGAMDKFGGLLFGALRGGVFGVLFVLLLSSLPLQKSAAWNESVLLPAFGYAIAAAVGSAAFSDYSYYWRFDANNRPRLALADAVFESVEQEIAGDGETAAATPQEEIQEDARTAADEAPRDAECDGDECAVADE